jgi:hypothetical protein
MSCAALTTARIAPIKTSMPMMMRGQAFPHHPKKTEKWARPSCRYVGKRRWATALTRCPNCFGPSGFPPDPQKGGVMLRFRVAATLLVVGWLAGSAQLASGQGNPPPSYRPSTPTFSPWMDLYQHSGVLDNYHNYVRPQLRLRETLRNQENSIQSLGQYVYQPQSQKEGNAAPTGIGAGFMSYSHYYPSSGMSARAPEGSSARYRTMPPRSPSSYRPTGFVGSF